MRKKSKGQAKPKTIDDYLAALDDEQREALERLRKTILKAAPGAEGCISYGMPAFRFEDRMLVWFGAAKSHCSFYPGGIVETYRDELQTFGISKGTIRFQPNKPIPVALVRKLVKARIAQNRRRAQG
jgi:uncharacterized protein YdhG (YjbR/CyaY superfamily)